MVGQQHRSDYKLSTIKHYESSDKVTETSRVFDCYRKTLKLWYDKYKAICTITHKNREISKNRKDNNYRNDFLYAFVKNSVKKIYIKNSTLKKKPKIYKDSFYAVSIAISSSFLFPVIPLIFLSLQSCFRAATVIFL